MRLKSILLLSCLTPIGCGNAPEEAGSTGETRQAAASTLAFKPLARTSMHGVAAGTVVAGGSFKSETAAPDPGIDGRTFKSGVGKPLTPPGGGGAALSGNPVTSNNRGFAGWQGLTHADQRFAGSGPYANSQFSLEPPDQALCAGNGFVVEAVNTALRIYDTRGNALTPPIALNQFFGLAPELDRNTGLYGDFTSDPKCYFDNDTNRWFITLLHADTDPASGGFLGTTGVLVAVSTTSDPTGDYLAYLLPTTNDGSAGTPNHGNCPCLGDQPLIGADKNGFYISTNEFSLVGPGFNGAQVYATSKLGLERGVPGPVVLFDNNPLAEGPGYSIQPATSPPGARPQSQQWDEDGGDHSRANGVEYFLSSLDFTGTVDNRIAVWAMTNTASLNTNAPALGFSHMIVGTETYGQPPVATQKDGPRPLADYIASVLGAKPPAEYLNTNDDRMNQVVFAHGSLYGAVNTIVQSRKGGAPTSGIAWFQIRPQMGPKGLSARVAQQGYVTVANNNVMFPSIGVNRDGQGVIAFSVSGPSYYPSVGYTALGESDDHCGSVHIGAAGALPDDGFTGYEAFSGTNVARWGDYSAATAAIADNDGTIWLASEYIPNAPRTFYANWGTFVGHYSSDQ